MAVHVETELYDIQYEFVKKTTSIILDSLRRVYFARAAKEAALAK